MRKNRYFLVLLLVFATPVFAGWEEGVAAFKAGNFAQAAKEFEALVAANAGDGRSQYMLGRSYLKAGKPAQAVAALRKAYDLSPADANTQIFLAQAYVDAGQAAQAVELLGRLNTSGLSADQQRVYSAIYTEALGKSGQTERATVELAKLAKQKPNDADVQYQYGAMAYNAGNTAEAIAALERATRVDPKDPAKAKLLVQASIRNARESQGGAKDAAYGKAAEAARTLVALQPTYDNLVLLGEAQLGGSQYDAAIATFQQATTKNGADWLPLFYTGQAQTAKGSLAEAETALQRAIPKASESRDKARIWRQLGFVYEKQKNYPQAKTAYANAGDSAAVARVEENQKAFEHNQQADEEAKKYAELKKAQEEARKALQEGAPPPR